MRERINPTDLARNHWTYILTQLDVKPEALTGKHTACPHCGGEDRFRFDNKEGAGTFYCGGCGAGTGYALIMKLKGIDFPEAVKLVEGMINPEAPVDQPPDVMSMTERRASLNRLWKKATLNSGKTVEYLVSRGLSEEIAKMAAGVLRFTDQAWFREEAAFLPAMLALVTRLSGGPVSIHRTFLLPDGRREKMMMPGVGELKGAGVWFGWRTSTKWIIGEGIETTLAGLQSVGEEGWTAVAALNAHGMESIEVPGHVEQVMILSDNDSSFTGQKAAFSLAHRLTTRKSSCSSVIVSVPVEVDSDYLDMVNACMSREECHNFTGGREREQEPSCVAGDREPKARPVGQRQRIHRSVCSAGS